MVFGVGGSNGAISGSIKSKMAADGHLGMTVLSGVTLAPAGLSCLKLWTGNGSACTDFSFLSVQFAIA